MIDQIDLLLIKIKYIHTSQILFIEQGFENRNSF